MGIPVFPRSDWLIDLFWKAKEVSWNQGRDRTRKRSSSTNSIHHTWLCSFLHVRHRAGYFIMSFNWILHLASCANARLLTSWGQCILICGICEVLLCDIEYTPFPSVYAGCWRVQILQGPFPSLSLSWVDLYLWSASCFSLCHVSLRLLSTFILLLWS